MEKNNRKKKQQQLLFLPLGWKASVISKSPIYAGDKGNWNYGIILNLYTTLGINEDKFGKFSWGAFIQLCAINQQRGGAFIKMAVRTHHLQTHPSILIGS